MPRTRSDDFYWVLEEDSELIAQAIHARVREYWTQMEEDGRLSLYRTVLSLYYGTDSEGRWGKSKLIRYGGDAGELSEIQLNHLRSLVRHLVVMTTSNRPAFEARAVNSDVRSLSETIVAEGVLDYYLGEGRVEETKIAEVERAIVLGQAWETVTWDFQAGDETMPNEQEELDPMTGEPVERAPIRAGDISVQCWDPWQVAHDLYTRPEDQRWRIVSDHNVNKWELAAEFPELAKEILDEGTKPDDGRIWEWGVETRDPDNVTVRHFYHRQSAAVPEGLYIKVCGDVVLFRGALPYDEMPVRPMLSGSEIGAETAYADVWDLIPLQQAVNSTASAMLSVHDAFGVPNIIAPSDANVNVDDIAGGMRLITFDGEPNREPHLLDMLRLDDASPKLLDLWVRTMEQLSGVNQVTRGDPPSNLKSGAALALVQSMALQYTSGLQRMYTRSLEETGNAILSVLKRYAHEPRMMEIVGRDQRSMLKQFSGADIAHVRRVVVNVGNPLMRTTAGRLEVATQLIEMPPEERETFLSVVDTGRLDSKYEATRTRALLIRAENERLADGTAVKVLATDPHELHIQEHLSLLDNPDVRDDDMTSALVLQHIQEHIDMRMQLIMMNPELAAMTGNMPAGGPPMPAGAGAPDGAPPEIGDVVAPTPEGAAGMPGLPQMPTEPLSGQKFQPGVAP